MQKHALLGSFIVLIGIIGLTDEAHAIPKVYKTANECMYVPQDQMPDIEKSPNKYNIKYYYNKCMECINKKQYYNYTTISTAKCIPADATPPPKPGPGSSVAVEAGPMNHNAIAQYKCPGICSAAGMTFTGHWWHIDPGKMSVCQCKIPVPQPTVPALPPPTVLVPPTPTPTPTPVVKPVPLPVPTPTPTPLPVVVKSPSFSHAPDGDFTKAHTDVIINYIAWDGTRWTAKFNGLLFVLAPNGNGDWSNSRTDAVMQYQTSDGSKWSVKLDQRRFLHAPNGDFTKAHADDIIIYKSWDGKSWTARLVW